MAVKNNVLHSIYKLNGQVYDIQTSSITTSSSEPAKMDRVTLDRLGGGRTSSFSAASSVSILISVH